MLYKLSQSVILLGVVILTVSFAAAQQAPPVQPKVKPEKEALIKELLVLTGTTKNATEGADVMLSFQQAEVERLATAMFEDNPNLTEQDRAELRAYVKSVAERMSKKVSEFYKTGLNLEKVIEEISLPIYDKHFTESELRDLIAFYKTPVGKKVIEQTPQMMMETMAGFSEKLAPKISEFFRKLTDEELRLVRQKVEAKKDPQKPKGN